MAVILCVDDIADNLNLLEADLGDEGFEVRLANNGAEALASVAEHVPDAVLLDISMPGMSGLEVLRVLRRTHDLVHLPVIMTTALGQPEDIAGAIRMGANDYVVKPLDIDVLLARLSCHLKVAQLTRERDELSALRDDFLAVAAHDLRSPLTTVIAAAGLVSCFLEEGPQGIAEAKNTLQLIERSGKTMCQLIDDFVDFRVLEGGALSLTVESFDLLDLVREVFEAVSQRAREKQVTLTLASTEPVALAGDRTRLGQVVRNLADNALKFSPPKATVTATVSRFSDQVRLAVSDEGPGLTEKDLARVFGKFARLSAVPTAGEKSSGLGLYITRMLVDAHGGQIRVHNNPARGATFVVELPATS